MLDKEPVNTAWICIPPTLKIEGEDKKQLSPGTSSEKSEERNYLPIKGWKEMPYIYIYK